MAGVQSRKKSKHEEAGGVARDPAGSGLPAAVAQKTRAEPAAPQIITKERHRMLTSLFDVHKSELVSTLRRLFGNGPPEPEDIAQSAFWKIASLSSDYHIDNPKPFLFKVAINLARQAYRKAATNQRFISNELDLLGPKLEEISPERLLQGKEAISLMDAAFQTLTPRQKEIVTRSRLKGETYAEIAAATGWSLATISRQLHAAMEVLEAAVEMGNGKGPSEA